MKKPLDRLHLYTKLSDSSVYKDSSPSHKALVIAILLLANHKKETRWDEGKEKEVKFPPGTIATTFRELASEAEVSLGVVKSSLDRMQDQGFIKYETRQNYTFIDVVNWDKYQDDESKEYKNENKVRVPYEQIKLWWNRFAKKYDMDPVKMMSDNRKKHLRARWPEWTKLAQEASDLPKGDIPDALKFFLKILGEASKQRFLLEEDYQMWDSGDNRLWRIDFNWLIKNNNNYVDTLEHKYPNKDEKTLAEEYEELPAWQKME